MTGRYTLKKLTDVEDSAPKFGYDELQEARFATRDLEAEHTGVSHHRVKPGKRQGFAHKHDEAEEVYVVLKGSGRIKLDDDYRHPRFIATVAGQGYRFVPTFTNDGWAEDDVPS